MYHKLQVRKRKTLALLWRCTTSNRLCHLFDARYAVCVHGISFKAFRGILYPYPAWLVAMKWLDSYEAPVPELRTKCKEIKKCFDRHILHRIGLGLLRLKEKGKIYHLKFAFGFI